MRFFNTAGPVNCKDHYCLPPLSRFYLDELLMLIAQKKYFVLHAPRQTGKTSCLLALTEYLNQTDRYRCLYVNVEAAQAARERVEEGIRTILSSLASSARSYLKDETLENTCWDILQKRGAFAALEESLTVWAEHSPLPLVLLIDEIDSLVGDTLISVLRQLRSGYPKRPALFPQTIVLCGVRDIRDYRIHSDREKMVITGGSAFNIRAESLRLGDFSREDIGVLYGQHTEETGQEFAPGVWDLVWDLTRGQPWLVNALAYEVCFRMKEGRDRTRTVTTEMISQAKENLILRRETHLDQLADKLREERVKRVIGPILRGEDLERSVTDDDLQYVIDLGLIRRGTEGPSVANSIYREVIPRQLTTIAQANLESRFQPAPYILPDGRLDMIKLLGAFQDFFRQHSEHWIERFEYKEAGPQLLLQAFLQRIVNSGGRIEREYGLGRMRTDLLVIWPHPAGVQKAVIELKILHRSPGATVEQGLSQTFEYMDRCGADEGHLVIFDRRKGKTWEEKLFHREETVRGRTIHVWGV